MFSLVGSARDRRLTFPGGPHHGDAAIRVVTASELLVGVHRADTEARRQKRSAFVEAILSQIPVFDFTTQV